MDLHKYKRYINAKLAFHHQIYKMAYISSYFYAGTIKGGSHRCQVKSVFENH